MQRVWRSASGLYHVSARGTGKQLIFENDDDRWEFLDLMRDCCRDKGVTILAWCLMGNHVHLVLADYEDGMSAAMQRLLLTYARRFNKRTGRTGHLFQNRFDRRSLDDDRHLMAAIRYVHANPQEAGICPLEQYKWSSFSEYLRAYDGEGPLASRTLRLCSTCLGRQRASSRIHWRYTMVLIRCFIAWIRRSGSVGCMPTTWLKSSVFRLISSRPCHLHSATGLYMPCTTVVIPYVRLSVIRGLARAPFRALCEPFLL